MITAAVTRTEGTTIVLRTTPAVGILALTSFTDDATSTNPASTFTKTFRFTTNGVIYSEWLPLTIENILAIVLTAQDVFVAEISYFLNEPSGTSYLTVTEAQINTTAATIDPSTTFYFDNSIFKQYFNSDDIDVLNWYINVLEKLYEKGLIANFIERTDINGSPDDFLAFWTAVTKLFSFYVKYARTFAEFYNNTIILQSFLEQRGLQISVNDTLQDMQQMLRTYYLQMGNRGTRNIINVKNDSIEGSINGELLRIIFYENIDEFLFCPYQKQNFGWNLGNSSPLHTGLRVNTELNKVPWSPGYVGMTGASTYITGNATISGDTLSIGSGGGGLLITGANAIVVNPAMDYQFSFLLQLNTGQTVTFGITGKDANGNSVNLTERNDGATATAFFTNAVMSRQDKFIQIRCYLYNSSRGLFSADTTNIKQGHNLIADAALDTVSLSITTDGVAAIKDVRIVPLRTPYSRGFIQTSNFISSFLLNRNNRYTLNQLQDYVQRYLVPYNSIIKITNIGDYLYTQTDQPIDQTYWAGAGEYCRKLAWIGSDPSCEVALTMWVPDDSTSYCEQT